MGLRIHKSVGYGITDFVAPTDWGERLERVYACSLTKFLKWTKKNIEVITDGVSPNKIRGDLVLFECLIRQDLPKGATLAGSVIDAHEFGISGVLQLIPPGYHRFNRYDDSIDYFEEAESSEPRYRELGIGLYPFSKGEIPVPVMALAHYIGLPEVIPHLKESLYVYWV